LVEGRLRYRTWETDDGQRRGKHDIFVERFSFVGGRQDGEGGGGGSYEQPSAAASTSSKPSTPPPPGPDEPPVTDDDIPF